MAITWKIYGAKNFRGKNNYIMSLLINRFSYFLVFVFKGILFEIFLTYWVIEYAFSFSNILSFLHLFILSFFISLFFTHTLFQYVLILYRCLFFSFLIVFISVPLISIFLWLLFIFYLSFSYTTRFPLGLSISFHIFSVSISSFIYILPILCSQFLPSSKCVSSFCINWFKVIKTILKK